MLEVGACNGTTSCAVIEKQGNSGNHITLEGDTTFLGIKSEKALILVDEDRFMNMP